MFNRVKGKLILVGLTGAASVAVPLSAQVIEKGLSPASNTFRSHQDASIRRDSGLYQPLDLLNDFYPSVEVVVSKHDNVRRRPDFDEEDLRIDVKPSLGYRTNFGRHQFYAAYQGSFVFHDEIDQEDAESNRFDAKLGLDLTRRWDLELFGGIGEAYEQRGVSGGREFFAFQNNGIDSGPETVDYVNYGADLIFGRKIGILQAVLGYEYSGTNYNSSGLAIDQNFSDSRDRESESIHFDLNWQFADKTSVFGRVQQTDIDYDRRDTSLDSTQTDYLVGLRWKPTGALNGTLGVGYSTKEYENPLREDYDGSIYYANVNYAFNPFSTLSLNASRTVEEPGDISADFYESEYVGIGWSHSINSKVSFGAYAKAVDDDYNTNREDQFVDWGLELNYNWRNWLAASLFYGEIERDSSEVGVDYDDRYYGIRIRSDLRTLLDSREEKRVEPYSFGGTQRTKSTQGK